MIDREALVRNLREEAERLSGLSLDRGVQEAGISANLAERAADVIEELQEVLQFYADEANWTEPNQVNHQELFETPMGEDLGERARIAMEAHRAD